MDDVSYSISSGKSKQFGLVDFIVFGITLIVSLFIGIFYAYKDRNIKDPSEFLIGGGNMGIFPVSLSLTVTFLSALTLLGMPAEIYNFNTMFWWLALGMVLAVAGAAHIFNPVFFRMGITSVYEYLEMRFGKMMGVLASLNWMITTLFYLAFVLYAPSLALKSVTGMELWVSILTVGGLVTFYTSIGGMKTVLWTDSYQAVLIVVGLLAVFIQGCIVVGGFPHAWDIATNKSRIMFNDFSFDPGTRHSFWSVVIGGGVMWMSFYAVNQCQVQRLLALSSVRRVQIALWFSAASLVLIVSLCCMIGVVLFAFYSNCHPVHYNLISTADELLPLFVMDILSHLKGLPGVFLTCIFSGSLSSLSSGINSISAVVLQDYIRAFSPWEVSDFHATIITKVTAAVFGLLTIGMAFLASKLGSILQVSYKGISSFDGPLFGVFILGLFFSRANNSGTTIGYFISLTFMLWISIGSFLHAPPAQEADYYTDGCNGTLQTTAKENTTVVEADGFLIIYRLSYLYYTMTGALITIVTGYIASCITGYGKQVDVDPKLLHPIVRRFNRERNRVEEEIDLSLDKSETVGLHRNSMDQPTKRKDIYEVEEETL